VDTEGIVFASFMVLIRSMFWQYRRPGLPRKELESFVSNFANTHVNNAMLSFGDALHGGMYFGGSSESQKASEKVLAHAIKKTKTAYNYIRRCYHNNMFIDSGGFQIQMGFIDEKGVPILTDGYCNLMTQLNDPNTYYFIEDVLPSDKIKNLDSAIQLSIDGIHKMAQLPEFIRKNIYYIYHFQTPDIFAGWQRVLREAPPEMLGGHRWSVGGIVSKGVTSADSTFISYMLPMQDIIRREWDYMCSKQPIYFHILGVTAQLDILFFALFEALLKSYGFNVHMTFDSTSTIMSVCRGNVFWYWTPEPYETYHEISLHPRSAKKLVKTMLPHARVTNEEVIMRVVRNMQETYGFKGVEKHYNEDTNRMETATQYIFMLHQMFTLQQMHRWCKKQSLRLIDCFHNSTPADFIKELIDVGTRIRSVDTTTSAIRAKATSISNTLISFDSILQGNHKTLEQIMAQTRAIVGGIKESGKYEPTNQLRKELMITCL